MITTLKEYSTLSQALSEHALCNNPDQDGTKLVKHLRSKNPTATYAVLFVNLDSSSSQFGRYTVMAVGPAQTYKTLEEVQGSWLFDLPSQRQYPVAYVNLGGVK